LQKAQTADLDVIETSAILAMLHSFYTLIEKILVLIGREVDQTPLVPPGRSFPRI
jgi:hypothetical protein